MRQKRILVTGATGLVGRALSRELIKDTQLVVVGRSSEPQFREKFPLPCQYFQWSDPERTPPPRDALDVDGVVNLMGESLTGRWTENRKKLFYTSRILTTRQLVSALGEHTKDLQVFVSASAIGIYGSRGDEILTEKSLPSDDFLGKLCQDWEAAAALAPGRVVCPRIGMVLSKEGGALEKLVPLFKMGMGGRLSSGKQWMSWIEINDLMRILIEALRNQNLRGPLNATAPEPVTNSIFTEHLAKSLGTHPFFPVPKLALKLALGEMADVVLSSQRVKPDILEKINFKFQFPDLKSALHE